MKGRNVMEKVYPVAMTWQGAFVLSAKLNMFNIYMYMELIWNIATNDVASKLVELKKFNF